MEEVAGIDVRTIVAILAAVISAVSAIISVHANWRARLISQTSIKIAKFNTKQSARAQLRNWAEEAMDIMSEAYVFLCVSHKFSDANDRRASILAGLTSSIDKGRWLLPNSEHVQFGGHKESAYKGLRQSALDDLVAIYNVVTHHSVDSITAIAADEAMKLKRQFASAIQEKLEPRDVEADLRLLSQEP